MLVLLPQFDKVLHPVKDLRLDDKRMAFLHIVLRDRAVVFHPLFSEVVLCVSLLEQGATFIFLVHQDALDRAAVPDVLSGKALDAQVGQFLGNLREGKTSLELGANDAYRIGFLLVDDQFAVLAPVVAEEVAERHHGLSVGEALVPAPGDVERNAPAFFLGEAGHDADQKFALGIEGPDVLFFIKNGGGFPRRSVDQGLSTSPKLTLPSSLAYIICK